MTTTRKLPTRWRRPARLVLRLLAGPDVGRALPPLDAFTSPRVLVGRASVNDVVLHDEHVSGAHCEFVLPPSGGLHLRDLDSRNGVYIDGIRVYDAEPPIGSKIRVGQTVLELLSLETEEVALSPEGRQGPLIGDSPGMRELFLRIEKLARTPLPVLITGETGTGKEVVARQLHALSARAERPFIALNCANIPASLAEAELFGAAKGSFTGAHTDREGVFEAADGGTLLLDELGELPLELQPKLLRVLESGEVTRIGERRPRRVDVRLICATLRDLREMVSVGRFREDLYFRVAGVKALWLTLPRLRERGDDVIGIAEGVLEELARTFGRTCRLSASAQATLRAYSWPGNVRELRRVIEAAFHLTEGEILGVGDLGGFDQRRGGAAGAASLALDGLYEGSWASCEETIARHYFERLLAGPGTFLAKCERAGFSDQGLRKKLRTLGIATKSPPSTCPSS